MCVCAFACPHILCHNDRNIFVASQYEIRVDRYKKNVNPLLRTIGIPIVNPPRKQFPTHAGHAAGDLGRLGRWLLAKKSEPDPLPKH